MSSDDSERSESDSRGRRDDSDDAAAVREGVVRTDDGGREVVLPMRLYKTVTVFSTLVSVLLVVCGFLLLDAATLQTSFLRSDVVVPALNALGAHPAPGLLDAVFAVAGLAVVAGGGAVYVFGTRFRAAGMGADAGGDDADGADADADGADAADADGTDAGDDAANDAADAGDADAADRVGADDRS